MEIWEVTNPVASLKKNASQSSYKSTTNVASEYSKILAKKISNVKADVQQMAQVQEQLDEICDLQEELTGEVKINEDSGNANRDGSGASTGKSTETVKRFLPDGSILVTTYEGSRIVEQVKHKPHMTVVPDYNAPLKPDGTVATKLDKSTSIDLAMLLMM